MRSFFKWCVCVYVCVWGGVALLDCVSNVRGTSIARAVVDLETLPYYFYCFGKSCGAMRYVRKTAIALAKLSRHFNLNVIDQIYRLPWLRLNGNNTAQWSDWILQRNSSTLQTFQMTCLLQKTVLEWRPGTFHMELDRPIRTQRWPLF